MQSTVVDIHPGLRRRLQAVEPTVNNRDIAEKLLAAALANYRAITTSAQPDTVPLRTWPELSEEEQAFYLRYAIPAAVRGICWQGRVL